MPVNAAILLSVAVIDMSTIGRIALALLPLLLTPALVQLIASGWLDLGGGEKDLVVVLPWALWSLLFAVTSLVLWRRGSTVVRSTVWAALVGAAGLVGAAVCLAVLGQLGVGGRF